jgi:hypothetical protein
MACHLQRLLFAVAKCLESYFSVNNGSATAALAAGLVSVLAVVVVDGFEDAGVVADAVVI